MMCCAVASDSGVSPSEIAETWSLNDLLDVIAFRKYQNMSEEEQNGLRTETDSDAPNMAAIAGFFDAQYTKSNSA